MAYGLPGVVILPTVAPQVDVPIVASFAPVPASLAVVEIGVPTGQVVEDVNGELLPPSQIVTPEAIGSGLTVTVIVLVAGAHPTPAPSGSFVVRVNMTVPVVIDGV